MIDELKTTDEHPFWVVGEGWVKAGNLAVGESLLRSDGGVAVVESTLREDYTTGVSVFNFEVERSHNYFVAHSAGGIGVLVHNACGANAAQLVDESMGSFSIIDWSGYPAKLPIPKGPFKIITGESYRIAKECARQQMPQSIGSCRTVALASRSTKYNRSSSRQPHRST